MDAPSGAASAAILGTDFRAVVLALVAAVLLVPAVAAAHLGHVVTRAERYLKIDAAPAGTRVVVSLTLGPSEMARVLGAADADRDGAVSAAEGDRYMAQWGDGLRTDLPVVVDGQEVAVRWDEPYMDPIGAVRPVNGTVEMIATLALEPGRHEITLRDRMRVETFDRTDVAFQARDGARLVASGPGRGPRDVVPELAFGARSAPGELTAVIELPGETSRFGALHVAIAALLVAVGIIAWIVVRRRRRSE